MKVKIGGGHLDAETGKLVRHPEREVEVADDWFNVAMAQMLAAPLPNKITVSSAAYEALKEEARKE